MSNKALIPKDFVISKIYKIRGQKIILDNDLAALYEVDTKALKQAVKRNLDVFPSHFMFELTKEEHESLRSQFVTSKKGRGGTRYLPMVFTEHGILQAANVLRSKRARFMSVRITEIFINMREVIKTHEELFYQMEEIRTRVSGQDEQISLIFEYIKQFENVKEEEWNQATRDKIGFKQN